MAGLEEIALGIASILQHSPAPEPLPVTFRGQTLEDGADLVLRIVSECRDADIPLSHVALDPALWGFLQANREQFGILLLPDPELSGEARFYRYNADRRRRGRHILASCGPPQGFGCSQWPRYPTAMRSFHLFLPLHVSGRGRRKIRLVVRHSVVVETA